MGMPEFLNNAQYNFQTTGCTIVRRGFGRSGPSKRPCLSRACPAAWCNKPALTTVIAVLPGWSGPHGGQPDDLIVVQWGDGFQCHVADSLHCLFIVLFQKDRAHEAEDVGFIGKDPRYIRSPLDLFIETFDRIGGVDLRPVVFREGGVLVFAHFGERTQLQGAKVDAHSDWLRHGANLLVPKKNHNNTPEGIHRGPARGAFNINNFSRNRAPTQSVNSVSQPV